VVVPVRDISAWGQRRIEYSTMMSEVRRAIDNCDLLVADVTERGQGIAAEIGIAYALKRPVIVFTFDSAPLSESIQGMATHILCCCDAQELERVLSMSIEKNSWRTSVGRSRSGQRKDS
jgi:2'-deoxynucleoside 5'-phosphate N-hydrolase